MVNTILDNRYIRNFKSLTKSDQKKLNQSRISIIGLGGLGGCVLEMLARIGIGHICAIDHDTFDASNLNRQILSQESLIGISKTNAAIKHIKSINSQINIKCINKCLNKDNAHDLIKGSNIVIDCLDSIKTRFVLQEACKKVSIPLVSGAIEGASGQVSVIFPQDKGFELIYGDKKTLTKKTNNGNDLGNLSFCVFFISSLQVSECIKIILKRKHILRNKLFVADLWTNSFDIVNLI